MKHAQEKALERHGVKISIPDLTQLRRLIEGSWGYSAWFYKFGHPPHTEKWIVEYNKELWYLVYDPKTRRIVTILDDPHPAIVKRVVIKR